MTIQILYKQGYSKKGISRKLGLSINTVRKYLRTGQTPAYSKRAGAGKASKLSPYYDYIKERINSAYPHWVPATVILREIKSLGYSGGVSILRSYMSELKPMIKEDAVVRYETCPGEQMQVDWTEFRRGEHRLSAFIAILGYSRAAYVEFVTDEKLETLIRCHEHAFAYFGGMTEKCLYDNMKVSG